MRAVLAGVLLTLVSAACCLANDWTRFRGPNGSGLIAGPPIPTSWSSEENLKWKTALPGKGSSSPVVIGDRIYVTCYTGYGLDAENPGSVKNLVRHLLALDRSSGSEVWRASIAATDAEDPYQGFITQHGYASSSPVTDGDRVYVLFGKSGLFAFNRDGTQLWHVDLGQKSDPAKWGDASSPILVGDILFVNAGILGNQLVGIDKWTGEEVWSLSDPAFTNSWSTPTEVRIDGKTQVLVQVPKKVLSIDPENGNLLWTAETPLDDATCGSIVTKGETAYLMGGRAGHAMALKCDGSGDVSQSKTIWKKRLRSGISTPLIVGDNMYWTTGGIFFAADLESGEYLYKQRLPRLGGPTGGFPNADYSSAVAVGETIVQFTRNGESYVIEAGDEFKLIAHNPTFPDDPGAFSATPAISEGELFVRSDNYLYCISSK